MTDVHKALRVALAQRNMTQTDLARLLGVTPGCVHQWISTDRSMTLRTINRIAGVLGVKSTELLALGESSDQK